MIRKISGNSRVINGFVVIPGIGECRKYFLISSFFVQFTIYFPF